MFELIDSLISMIMTAITQSSPLAIITLFLVVALTECGIPFPFILDSILFLTSYQTGASPMLIIYVFVIVFLGRQFGAGLIYWLTRLLGNVIISWFTKRYKKAERNWENVTEKISTQAPMPIALVRLTGLMTLASVLSGAMQIRYISFFLGVAFSALIFDGSLIILGLITKYGFRFIGFTPSVWHVALGLIILMSIFMVIVTIINRRRQTALDKSNKQ